MSHQDRKELPTNCDTLWTEDGPLPALRPWDTADYLREERMVGLATNCRMDDGDDYGPDPAAGWLGGGADPDETANFSQVIHIPEPLVNGEIIKLWQRIYSRILLGLPAETGHEFVIRATRKAAIAYGAGRNVSPGSLIIGCLLAVAKAEKVAIRTHPRDLAKDLGVRYSTLLLVRRLALAQIKIHGARLGVSVE